MLAANARELDEPFFIRVYARSFAANRTFETCQAEERIERLFAEDQGGH